MARTAHNRWAEHVRFCPGTSGVNLLRYRERVINLNAQISDGALDLCVAELESGRPEDCLCADRSTSPSSAGGNGSEKLRIKYGFGDSIQRQAARIGV